MDNVQDFKPPKLIVPRRVLLAMADEGITHPATETGQSIIGLQNEDFILVLGTIPDIQNSDRSYASFGIGGKAQVEIWRWVNSHWEEQRKASREEEFYKTWKEGDPLPEAFVPEKYDLPLTVLGDWHKHPGDMRELSDTDRRQIQSILRDKSQKKTQLIAPILIYDPDERMELEIKNDQVLIRQTESEIWINWWYANIKKVHEIRRVKPMVVADNLVPWLPPLPWHLEHPRRMRRELALLKQARYKVFVHVMEMGGDKDIREIVFAVDHPSWQKRLLLITSWDYPNTLPLAKIIDKPGYEESENPAPPETASQNFFEWLRDLILGEDRGYWEEENPIDDGYWDQRVYLIDVIKKLEDQGGLRVTPVGQGSENPRPKGS